ncbi:phage integrase Arm DNA-binding domain-containing protein [Serratia symbiotica]|uniref:phage integrase Arm DNA-binding domain-containing protein n=1 Tax=Serratia symbiotica TaxID=138074 RepID=UPI0013605412|nr:phage integrase Arm DNA-binding domain-containing protein [Serratia symbiotica]MBQ0956439.1 phage integrase Arm DNA-binding domain-containing protein [Serratia symbiotica]
MMGRPRKFALNIPGLYCSTDKRTQRIYWKYKHPITGVVHGLGTNADEAKAIAIEANSRLSEQQLRNTLAVRDKLSRAVGGSISVSTWLDRYLVIQEERKIANEITENTVKQKIAPVKAMRKALAAKPIRDVDTRDIADILDDYKKQGHSRMAQVVRTTLIDVFKEAQHAGEVPPGYNPAEATKNPHNRVSRERLILDEFNTMLNVTPPQFAYMKNAMLLALVTAQREGDISKMQFSDVWDGHLHVEQIKTGAKVAIPLSLRCDAIGMTLEQVITQCRDHIVSPYLVHFIHNTSMARRGGIVKPNTISTSFKKIRELSGLSWDKGSPPTFHEIRSLSERIYREQKINTKDLLGHKSQRQTDRYNDDRGKEWRVVGA